MNCIIVDIQIIIILTAGLFFYVKRIDIEHSQFVLMQLHEPFIFFFHKNEHFTSYWVKVHNGVHSSS